jgi:hypothetical protein
MKLIRGLRISYERGPLLFFCAIGVPLNRVWPGGFSLPALILHSKRAAGGPRLDKTSDFCMEWTIRKEKDGAYGQKKGYKYRKSCLTLT